VRERTINNKDGTYDALKNVLGLVPPQDLVATARSVHVTKKHRLTNTVTIKIKKQNYKF